MKEKAQLSYLNMTWEKTTTVLNSQNSTPSFCTKLYNKLLSLLQYHQRERRILTTTQPFYFFREKYKLAHLQTVLVSSVLRHHWKEKIKFELTIWTFSKYCSLPILCVTVTIITCYTIQFNIGIDITYMQYIDICSMHCIYTHVYNYTVYL